MSSNTFYLIATTKILSPISTEISWISLRFIFFNRHIIFLTSPELVVGFSELKHIRIVTIVKLYVHFVSACLKGQKWIQTKTKVTFHQPPTRKLFWFQMKGMAKIRLFYFITMVLILPWLKDIAHLVFNVCLQWTSWLSGH